MNKVRRHYQFRCQPQPALLSPQQCAAASDRQTAPPSHSVISACQPAVRGKPPCRRRRRPSGGTWRRHARRPGGHASLFVCARRRSPPGAHKADSASWVAKSTFFGENVMMGAVVNRTSNIKVILHLAIDVKILVGNQWWHKGRWLMGEGRHNFALVRVL